MKPAVTVRSIATAIVVPVVTGLLLSFCRSALKTFGLLSTSGFMPHKMCLSGSEGVIWTVAISDGVTAICYLLIPISLLRVFRHGLVIAPSDIAKRKGVRALLLWFASLIMTCGLSHQMDVITLWFPYYYLDATVRVATAMASMGTYAALQRTLPTLLGIASVKDLTEQVDRLMDQMAALTKAKATAL